MFRTSYEARKWAKLERLANETLNSMKTGKGGKNEVQQLRQVVAEFGGVLVEALDASVSIMHAQANERIAEIERHRAKKGKEPLDPEVRNTLLEQAFNRVVQNESVELAVTIEGMLQDQLKANATGYESLLDSKFKSYFGDPKGSSRIDGLEKSVDQLQLTAQSLLRKKESTKEDEPETQVTAGSRLLPEEEAVVPTTVGGETELADVSTKLQNIGDQLDPTKLERQKRKNEEKRADSWWRRLSRSTMGNLKNIVSSKIGGLGLAGGIVALLGKMLLSHLTGTDTLGAVWSKLEGYVDPKNLAKYASEFLDYISQKARALVKWISDKISGVFSLSPETQAAHAQAPNETLKATSTRSEGRYEQFMERAEEAKAKGNDTQYKLMVQAAEKEREKSQGAEAQIKVNMEKAEAILPGSSSAPTGPVHTQETGGGAAMFPNRRLYNQQRRREAREKAAAGGSTEVQSTELSPSKDKTIPPAPGTGAGDGAGGANAGAQGPSIPSLSSIPYSTAIDPSFALLNSASLVN